MEQGYRYLIVGGGMAGDAAAQAIHQTDPDASIGILCAENHPPYDRPPLSKGLWKDTSEDEIWRPIQDSGAELHLGRCAASIDADKHLVVDDRGTEYGYEKLLLATGGVPRTLGIQSDRVIAYRSLDDYRHLRALAKPGARIAVVGGGFIGSELAASLAMNDCKVSLVFPEDSLGEKVYPYGLSARLDELYRSHGVELLACRMVKGGEQQGDEIRLQLDDGSSIVFDAVAAGLGIQPATALAEAAGLAVENGVVVDDCMRSSVADIFAAGDIASFPNSALGRRRVEHENAAISTGHRAGLAMAGKPDPYDELPFFYSDLFDAGYEAVGMLDARLDMAEDWVTPNHEGVVYYLDDGRVRGVLLWNVWGQVDAARALIADPGPHDADSLRGRIRG